MTTIKLFGKEAKEISKMHMPTIKNIEIKSVEGRAVAILTIEGEA